jgi:hypothetical protein
MLDTLVLLAIFVALAFLAIWFPKITHTTLIVLFASALAGAAAFLSMGLAGHF